MTKASMQELARLGARMKAIELQRTVAELFRDFPDVFAGQTPPVFVKQDLKPGGNDWPAIAATLPAAKTNGNGNSHGWTPERRAHQARVMKRNRAKLNAANSTRREAAPKAPKKRRRGREKAAWGTRGWQRMHDYLAQQPNNQAKAIDIVRAAGLGKSAAVMGITQTHPTIFGRVGEGQYQLLQVVPHE